MDGSRRQAAMNVGTTEAAMNVRTTAAAYDGFEIDEEEGEGRRLGAMYRYLNLDETFTPPRFLNCNVALEKTKGIARIWVRTAMGNPSPLSSLPLKLAFILSFSLTASSSSFSPTSPKPHYHSISIRKVNTKKPSATTASAGDILSLLGTPQQAASVNPQVAAELRSCFKFIVPFNDTTNTPPDSLFKLANRLSQSVTDSGIRFPRRTLNSNRRRDAESLQNELVWSPPAPVLEIARLAFDSGGDPGCIHSTLDPTMINVPDCEGSNENRCELTRTPYGRRFINEELNSYMGFLFKLIAARGPKVGLNVSLDRFDFFHGHLFITPDGRVGILFHAKEYPAFDKKVFPYNMGYCQKGSNVTYDDSMNLRNILWLAPLPSDSTNNWSSPGVLVVLDAHPGGIIYRDIIPNYVKYARTIYEDIFGDIVVDVNYLNVGTEKPDYKLFIC
ncbi:hypothetical protein L2E82_24560 [Cichorium intybus]|uniref:Uncharacterized protein n=1 Tax=Cichorium intybus TaxID=13427 RepID=A0ACB9E1D4_CICIN|nr:hypothetical protein L2E82_24560 [Cichorium intybus]